MTRKEFNILKKDIRSILSEIDKSFVPNHIYDVDSVMNNKCCQLVGNVLLLRDFLTK